MKSDTPGGQAPSRDARNLLCLRSHTLATLAFELVQLFLIGALGIRQRIHNVPKFTI